MSPKTFLHFLGLKGQRLDFWKAAGPRITANGGKASI